MTAPRQVLTVLDVEVNGERDRKSDRKGPRQRQRDKDRERRGGGASM